MDLFFKVIVNFLLLLITVCILNAEEIEEGSKPTIDIMNTINKAQEKAKDITGINNPEDIPEVADWMKTCEKKIGRKAFRRVKSSPKKMIDCILSHINVTEIEVEVKDSTKKGELELVFKKYCGRRNEVLECLDNALEVVKPCLSEDQLKDLNVTRKAVDAGIDFICYENGDRIALFLSEDGVGCVKNNSDAIIDCIQTKIPETKQAEDNPKSLKIDQFLITEENCLKINLAHQCVVDATTTCDDPTPSNILDSLITQALKVTPCQDSQVAALSSSSSFYKHFKAILPHFLIVVAAGLTAAQILL